MDHQRAETYLRLLAEAELRRVIALPAGSSASQWYAPALTLAAQALSAVGAIDGRIAGQIRADFDVACAARQPRLLTAAGQPPGGLSLAAQARLDWLTHVPAPAAAEALPRPGQAVSPPANWQIVPVGKGIAPDGFYDEQFVLAYLQAPRAAWFTLAVQSLGLLPGDSPGHQPGTPPRRHQFTAADDQGNHYQLRFRARHEQAVLELRPHPPQPIRWLDLRVAPGQPTVRIDLDTRDRQIPALGITVTPQAASPGELLLDIIAARILTHAADCPHDIPEQLAATQPKLLPHRPPELGAVTAALQAAGALPPDSPVPGQLAGLCARLGIGGHAITAPPAKDLPERWESLLGSCHRQAPRHALTPGSWAVPAAELPELDGVRLAVAGLQHNRSGTTMHLMASGVTIGNDWIYSRLVHPLPVLWIRDSNSHWHTTWTRGAMPHQDSNETILWLGINPPLEQGTGWIEITAAGRSAQACARLPLSWKQIADEV